jgi:Tfp pilus assembly protein PilF
MEQRRRKATTEPKQDVTPLLAQATGFAREGKLAEAIDRCRQALALDANNVTVHAELSHYLLENGEVDDAFHHIELAIAPKTVPPSAQLLTDMGRICATRGLLRRASEAFREALRVDPAFRPASQGLISVTEQLN